MNQYWLRSRLLDYDGLDVDVRNCVAEYMSMDDCPQHVRKKDGGTPEDVEKMIISLGSLLSCCMVPSSNRLIIQELDRNVRVFLSLLERVHKSMRRVNDKPIWGTSYSYPCLMNLPKVMEKYGALRNIWEGSIEGEGFIKRVKPHVHRFTKNWHANLAEDVL